MLCHKHHMDMLLNIWIPGLIPETTVPKNLVVLFVCIWRLCLASSQYNCFMSFLRTFTITQLLDVGQVSNEAAGWVYIAVRSALRLRSYSAGFGAAMICVAGDVMYLLTPYKVQYQQVELGFQDWLVLCWRRSSLPDGHMATSSWDNRLCIFPNYRCILKEDYEVTSC